MERAEKNPIYLNAGDNFQGTLWYNIGRWNVTSYFLNMLRADAMTIGNHEFDHGVAGVVPFLESVNSPVVISNVDDSLEPTFQGKYTNSIIIDKYDRKIGVIGVILKSTDNIADTGKLKFTSEPEAVKREAEKLKADGVNIIVVLSHCGLYVDREIAQRGGPDIDIIVGGHSHSFLYGGENPPGPDKPEDTYPVVETQTDGHKVLIVQASAYTKYLGEITLYFDDEGNVQRWEGQPLFLGNDVIPGKSKLLFIIELFVINSFLDPLILEKLKPWKELVDLSGKRVVGQIKVDMGSMDCYRGECQMGDLIADAMVHSVLATSDDDPGWAYATIGFTNPGGIRATLNRGALTYSDLVTTTPFENTVDSMELQGKYIREAMEFSVRYADSPSILQVSGMRMTFNLTKPAYQRLTRLDVLCRICDVPAYEPIEEETWYRIVVNSFLPQNGNNFAMVRDNNRNYKVGAVDIDALNNYIEDMTPIAVTGSKNRITLVR